MKKFPAPLYNNYVARSVLYQNIFQPLTMTMLRYTINLKL